MNKVFLQAVNISVTAGYLTLAILIIRKFFTQSPRWLNVILWALVAIRLVVPFSIQSEISLVPSNETFELNLLTEGNGDFYINSGIDIIDEPVNEYMGDKYYEGVTVRYNFKNDLTAFLAKVWLMGILSMLVYAAVSFIRLKSMMKTATKYKDNIYESEFVKGPFVLGIFSPKIYIPYDMSEKELAFVIAHENNHIKRFDHITKVFAYILLSAYWFNPVMWLAYKTFCEDLEMACDEAVIKDYDHESRQEYSRTLLGLGMKGNTFSACPLAFGEVGLKDRIKSIMDYKKPTKKIIIFTVILIALFVVFFMTDPVGTGIKDVEVWTERIFDDAEYVRIVTPVSEFTVTDEGNIESILELLSKIRVNKHEISKNRSEDRPKDYMIDLGGNVLCFDEGLTNVWIDNSVKPSFTYRIKNPKIVKEIIDFTGEASAERLKGEIITSFYDGEVLRYELKNTFGEYIGFIITDNTILEFSDKDDEEIITEITGGILWDGIYSGAYVKLDDAEILNDEAGYEWLDAKEYYTAKKITVTGFDKYYFLEDDEDYEKPERPEVKLMHKTYKGEISEITDNIITVIYYGGANREVRFEITDMTIFMPSDLAVGDEVIVEAEYTVDTDEPYPFVMITRSDSAEE